MFSFFKSFHFTRYWYMSYAFVVFLFLIAFQWNGFFIVGKIILGTLLVLTVVDFYLLYRNRKGIESNRIIPERLSNSDWNTITLTIKSFYNFPIVIEVIDEIPHQFQRRDILFTQKITANSNEMIAYQLRPTQRGVYEFGQTNYFIQSPLRLVIRKIQKEFPKEVAVYPSFLQMRQYELMAISNRLTEFGMKKIRRIGHSQEFEHIKSYVSGDDIRKINWMATARRNELMVNTYQEERSQNVYCIIDKGRVMKMPFDGMTLLDYAINATLAISNVALLKHDKAGLITFSNRIGQTLLANRKMGQLNTILETLYHQKTRFLESDYELLFVHLKRFVKQRSLLILFTNFETLSGLNRQMAYFRALAKEHLLLVVFFENTELAELVDKPSENTEEIYLKTIAEKYQYDKELLVKELNKYGIQALLTKPSELTINTLNRYLDFKARGMI